MILGNSFGNNKGKKYFIRNKDTTTNVNSKYLDQAQRFKMWFERDCKSVISYLKDRNIFDEDSINDAYLKMYETILYNGLNKEDFRGYFIRSIFTNRILGNVKETRYCELLPNFDIEDNDISDIIELERKQEQLVKDIFNYLYATSNIGEFELFKMYINLKPAVNYSTLAKITGLKSHNIQRTITKIKKRLRKHEEFLKRRKELIG